MPMENGRSPVAWDVKEDKLFCALVGTWKRSGRISIPNYFYVGKLAFFSQQSAFWHIFNVGFFLALQFMEFLPTFCRQIGSWYLLLMQNYPHFLCFHR